MKTLKIHLLWALVSIVSAAAWGQWVVRDREDRFREREKVLMLKIVEAGQAAPPAPVVSVEPPAAPAAAPPAQTSLPDSPVIPPEVPSAEELRKLLRSDRWQDLVRIVHVLNKLPPCPLKSELVLGLLKCKEDYLRRSALHHLRETLGNRAAAPILRELLLSDRSEEVRERAAYEMRSEELPGSMEALLQAFQKDELRVRVACAATLNERGHPGPAVQLLPTLSAGLDSPDAALRREAVERLGELRCPERMPLLAKALRDSSGDVRMEAVNALEDLDVVQLTALLTPLLQDPVAAVRDSVKDLLDQSKDKKE